MTARRFFRWLGWVLDPARTTRRYTVTYVDWSGGWSKHFWFRRNAERFAERVSSGWLFIDIEDDLTGRSVRVRDNPDKIPPPVRYIFQPGHFTCDVSSMCYPPSGDRP